MPKLRNRALRTLPRKVVTGRPVAPEEEKLRLIRALYITVYNSKDSLAPQAVELFHVLGAILEGASVADLLLYRIDGEFKRTVLELDPERKE